MCKFTYKVVLGSSIVRKFTYKVALGRSIVRKFTYKVALGSSIVRKFTYKVCLGSSIVRDITYKITLGSFTIRKFMHEVAVESSIVCKFTYKVALGSSRGNIGGTVGGSWEDPAGVLWYAALTYYENPAQMSDLLFSGRLQGSPPVWERPGSIRERAGNAIGSALQNT